MPLDTSTLRDELPVWTGRNLKWSIVTRSDRVHGMELTLATAANP